MLERATIVRAARGWIGTPYRHQASCKGAGCDCLGLIRGLWRELLGPEPAPLVPYTPDWAEASGKEALLEAAERYLVRVADGCWRPGDVLLFRIFRRAPAKHLAVVASPETMIHAQEGLPVAEVHLGPWWRRRIVGVFSFPGTKG